MTTNVKITLIIHTQNGKIKTNKSINIKCDGKQFTDNNFIGYTNDDIMELFNKYYIPTHINNMIVFSNKIYPYKSLPKLTIPVFEKCNKGQVINYGEYQYIINYKTKIITIRYKPQNPSTDIQSYPFTSFNGFKCSMEHLYENSNISTFIFDNMYTETIINTSYMFNNCNNLTTITPIKLNQHNKTYEGMFYGCIKLKEIDLSECSGEYSINAFNNMFTGCINMTSLCFGKLHCIDDIETISVYPSIFRLCYNLSCVKMLKRTFNKFKQFLPFNDLWLLKENAKNTMNINVIKECIMKESKNNTTENTYLNTFYYSNILCSTFGNKCCTITKDIINKHMKGGNDYDEELDELYNNTHEE